MGGERVDRSEYGFAIIASSLRDEFVPPHSSPLEEVAPRASFPPSPHARNCDIPGDERRNYSTL